MAELAIASRTADAVSLDSHEVRQLENALDGRLLQPGDDEYDEARTIWNAMIDRHPAAIARCATTADVQLSIEFARRHDLLVSIRGGGHNIAGNAVCDRGLMIDLSQLRWVEVDPEARIARVGPGATLGDVDAATQGHGLATPTGINSTTGIAGLTLGGGFGWLSRQHGLTCDNLIGADVVLADGSLVHASDDEHPDLFWALRGGGGNFGVVTAFEYRLHRVGPEVYSGLVVYPLDRAVGVMRRYREFVATLGDDTAVWAVLRKAPPLPFLPDEVHGTGILALAVFHGGDPDEGRRILEPVSGFDTPVGAHVGAQPFTDWQQTFDPLLTPGARNYWKSHNFTEVSDGLVEVLVEYGGSVPSPHCEIFLGQLGGATTRVAPDATAYPHRDAEFVANVHARWETAPEDAACITWAKDFYEAARPFATGGVYVNFLSEDEDDRVASAFGGNLERLERIKATYDPDNRFRVNQNIRPA